MEEKKLTDEEIVKALECCINDKCSEECPYRGKRYDCVYQHRHEKDLLDLIHRQKAEIERLKDEKYKVEQNLEQCENGYKLELHTARFDMCMNREKVETLQKQLQELELELLRCNNLKIKIDKASYEQAVKDTAKEIYTQVLEWLPVGEDYSVFIHNIEQWLKEKYGVEVE